MDYTPFTRKESKKSSSDKKFGHNNLVSAKGTRQKIALMERGFGFHGVGFGMTGASSEEKGKKK